ncbi:MAG: DNA-processing protein DprA [Solirubrobacteraceae bacterium]|nr:MAG: DNA-protecting protein DprA [Solirubrobacterales bacterium]
MSAGACERCLRRSALIARLAGGIELAERRRRGCAVDLLGLDDDALMRALDAELGPRSPDEHEREPSLRRSANGTAAEPLCRHDSRYPASLTDAPSPPTVLWVVGGIARLRALLAGSAVAVVGARAASAYGLEVARVLGAELASAGVTTISGMAFGIDAAVHAGSLERADTTIAVLAGGPDRPYPKAKQRLHTEIARRGCVVSELPPGTRSWRWAFPARNRIIASLAAMSVVVEAAEGSGALITARHAREIGRDVGGVPGRVTSPLAAGPNALVADGAALVRDAQDVLDAVFGAGMRHAGESPPLAPELAGLLSAVADGCDSLHALLATGREIDATLAGLAELELLGRLRRGPGGRYVAALG